MAQNRLHLQSSSLDILLQPTAHGHMLVANYHDNTVIEFDEELVGTTVLTSADGISGSWSGIVIGPGRDLALNDLPSVSSSPPCDVFSAVMHSTRHASTLHDLQLRV